MRIEAQLTDTTVLRELGQRLAQTRLERNLTQQQLGAEAGVGRTAVQRLEAGEPVMTANLIRVLRALGLLDALERLVPPPLPSPIEQLKLRGRRRRRASGARAKPDSPVAAGQPWRWGDQQ